MTLYRVELREAAKTALLAANTLAGFNVFTARDWPVSPSSLPCIYLQVPVDHGDSDGRGQPSFTRVASLMIVAFVAYGEPGQGENLLDVMTEQIELCIMQDVTLQGMIQQVVQIHTELVLDASNADAIGEARMRFDLEFTETYPLPGVPLVKISEQVLAGPDGRILAAATVTIPQD